MKTIQVPTLALIRICFKTHFLDQWVVLYGTYLCLSCAKNDSGHISTHFFSISFNFETPRSDSSRGLHLDSLLLFIIKTRRDPSTWHVCGCR